MIDETISEKVRQVKKQQADAETQALAIEQKNLEVEADKQELSNVKRLAFEQINKNAKEVANFLLSKELPTDTHVWVGSSSLQNEKPSWFSTTVIGSYLMGPPSKDYTDTRYVDAWTLYLDKGSYVDYSGDRSFTRSWHREVVLDIEGNLYNSNHNGILKPVTEEDFFGFYGFRFEYNPDIPIDEQKDVVRWQEELSLYSAQKLVENNLA